VVFPSGILDAVPVDPSEKAGFAFVVVVPKVGNPGKEGEGASVFFEQVEITGPLVVQPRGFRKEEGGMEAEVTTNEEEAFWAECGGALVGSESRGEHGVEERKRQTHCACFEEGPPGKGGT
jgi:hypothetical protein